MQKNILQTYLLPDKKRALIFSRVSTWFVLNVITFLAVIFIHFHFEISDQKWWQDAFSILINLLSGGLVSFLFYFLVVYILEKRKKILLKLNLQNTYISIKKDMLYSIIFASQKGGRIDLSAGADEIEALMHPKEFKEKFENGKENNEGFYAFANQMSSESWEFNQIILSLTMLSKQVDFILHNYPMEKKESFDLFKRLELFLMRLRATGPGYDESKHLCRFVWEIFAGWDPIEGYIGYDKIQKAIHEL